ncbi:hypothetical protein AC578_8447 [Pseudocercospora eumusae]|uniref:Uncharacterized protein n=1 Tax=Pseudocercospora eumusae TaxID=321146 RepID=A0A139H1U3_9PEZI|nr:hypothetical protein AC578_8447 [Pseudocercospora eumusae]
MQQLQHNMANQAPLNSVWSAMEYKPPRGRCNYKTSILSSCPCLRFMLHPVKAATSFDCDGCNHHASFHSLENTAEDAVLKKWSEQEAQDAITDATEGATNRKRRRIAEKPAEEIRILELSDDDTNSTNTVTSTTRKKTGKPRVVKAAQGSSKRIV